MVPTYDCIEHAFFFRSLIISQYAARTNYFWIVSNIMYFTNIIHYILHYCIGFESVSAYLVITGWEEANFSWEARTEHRTSNIFPQTVQPNLTIKVFFTSNVRSSASSLPATPLMPDKRSTDNSEKFLSSWNYT